NLVCKQNLNTDYSPDKRLQEINGEVYYVYSANSESDHFYKLDLCQFSSASINETKNTELLIYPNPAQDQLTIEIENLDGVENSKVEILNLKGQTVFVNESNQTDSKLILDLSSMAEGVYMIKISFG